MLATFIIGFHTARIDNLLQTLRFLHEYHGEVVRQSQLVLVCQNDCGQLEERSELDALREGFAMSGLTNMNLDRMHLPLVTNVGVAEAVTDNLIVLESDRILPAGYFAEVIEQIRPGTQITCRTMWKLEGPASDDHIRSGNFVYSLDLRDPENRLGMRNMWSGNTALHKSDYAKAGGMDLHYKGYGWADSDMTNRMAAVGVRSVFRDEIELHLWHPSATYGTGDQKQMFLDNGLYFCAKWGKDLPDWFRKELGEHGKVLML